MIRKRLKKVKIGSGIKQHRGHGPRPTMRTTGRRTNETKPKVKCGLGWAPDIPKQGVTPSRDLACLGTSDFRQLARQPPWALLQGSGLLLTGSRSAVPLLHLYPHSTQSSIPAWASHGPSTATLSRLECRKCRIRLLEIRTEEEEVGGAGDRQLDPGS